MPQNTHQQFVEEFTDFGSDIIIGHRRVTADNLWEPGSYALFGCSESNMEIYRDAFLGNQSDIDSLTIKEIRRIAGLQIREDNKHPELQEDLRAIKEMFEGFNKSKLYHSQAATDIRDALRIQLFSNIAKGKHEYPDIDLLDFATCCNLKELICGKRGTDNIDGMFFTLYGDGQTSRIMNHPALANCLDYIDGKMADKFMRDFDSHNYDALLMYRDYAVEILTDREVLAFLVYHGESVYDGSHIRKNMKEAFSKDELKALSHHDFSSVLGTYEWFAKENPLKAADDLRRRLGKRHKPKTSVPVTPGKKQPGLNQKKVQQPRIPVSEKGDER